VVVLLLLLGVAIAADTVTAVPCTRDGAYNWLVINGHVSKITFHAGCPE